MKNNFIFIYMYISFICDLYIYIFVTRDLRFVGYRGSVISLDASMVSKLIQTQLDNRGV